MHQGSSSYFRRHWAIRWSQAGQLTRLAPFTLLVLGLLLAGVQAPVASAMALEFPSQQGYEFGVTSTPDGAVSGFAVVDDDGALLWTAYQGMGGRAALGAAQSNRYACGPALCQAFERAVLRWNPDSQQAEVVDVLGELHRNGLDQRMERFLQIPPPQDWSGRDAGASADDPQLAHDKLYAATDALAGWADTVGPLRQTIIGVPMAVKHTAVGTVLRGTRGAVVDPETSPGSVDGVYVIGAGQIARAYGLVPSDAQQPLPSVETSTAPAPARLIVPQMSLDVPLTATAPDSDGSLPAPDRPEDVAWYADSARPGEGGTMILAGHVDWVGRRAAFRQLAALQIGDTFQIVDESGTPSWYQVQSTGSFDLESDALRRGMANMGRGPLSVTLVTCGGPFDVSTRAYLERTMVRAVPIPPPPDTPSPAG